MSSVFNFDEQLVNGRDFGSTWIDAIYFSKDSDSALVESRGHLYTTDVTEDAIKDGVYRGLSLGSLLSGRIFTSDVSFVKRREIERFSGHPAETYYPLSAATDEVRPTNSFTIVVDIERTSLEEVKMAVASMGEARLKEVRQYF